MSKGNQPELRQAIVDWTGLPQARPPEVVCCTKGHGWLERRTLWIWACGELSSYFAERFGWTGVPWCGWIERKGKEETSLHVWLAGAAFRWQLTAAQALAHVRRHWTIENSVFRVCDVTFDEDRLHGRKIGFRLSTVRNVAITLLRQLGFRFIPDVQRAVAANPVLAFALLGIEV